jgi:predicted transposase/invertase (TIGR01784 family)
MDFRLFPESTAAPLHTSFRACCPEAPQLSPLTDFIIHFIELPQFNQTNLPSTAFGRWMYYIKYRGKEGAMEDPIMKEILEDTSEIREAERRYQGFIADAELRDRLEARDKFRRTHLQLLHDAEERGFERGLAQGIEKGLEQVRNEKRREMARKMKRDGMAATDIARYTDLPEEEIREL